MACTDVWYFRPPAYVDGCCIVVEENDIDSGGGDGNATCTHSLGCVFINVFRSADVHCTCYMLHFIASIHLVYLYSLQSNVVVI